MAFHPEAIEYVFDRRDDPGEARGDDPEEIANRNHLVETAVFAVGITLGAIIGYQVAGWL